MHSEMIVVAAYHVWLMNAMQKELHWLQSREFFLSGRIQLSRVCNEKWRSCTHLGLIHFQRCTKLSVFTKWMTICMWILCIFQRWKLININSFIVQPTVKNSNNNNNKKQLKSWTNSSLCWSISSRTGLSQKFEATASGPPTLEVKKKKKWEQN